MGGEQGGVSSWGACKAPCNKGRLQAALTQGRRAPAAAQSWGAVERHPVDRAVSKAASQMGPLKKGSQPNGSSSAGAVQGTQSMGGKQGGV